MMKRALIVWALLCLMLVTAGGCVTVPEAVASPTVLPTETPAGVAPPPAEIAGDLADVTLVEVTGEPGAYSFRVTVLSPDTGCDQYANWWEVVGEEGELLYRRVLLHSHVNEMPFARTGSPVPVEADAVVYVRAHLHPAGYGGQAFKGSVQGGFEAVELAAEFAAELAEVEPLPKGCTH